MQTISLRNNTLTNQSKLLHYAELTHFFIEKEDFIQEKIEYKKLEMQGTRSPPQTVGEQKKTT